MNPGDLVSVNPGMTGLDVAKAMHWDNETKTMRIVLDIDMGPNVSGCIGLLVAGTHEGTRVSEAGRGSITQMFYIVFPSSIGWLGMAHLKEIIT